MLSIMLSLRCSSNLTQIRQRCSLLALTTKAIFLRSSGSSSLIVI